MVFSLACGAANYLFLRDDPFLSHPIIDAAEYVAEARAIVAGIHPAAAASIHGIVYPLLLVPFVLVSGAVPATVYLFQLFLVAASAVLVRSCGVRLVSRRYGNVAGVLMAASPVLLYFQVQLLPVVFQVFLHSMILYLLIVRGNAGSKTVAAAGVLCGLSWLTHPGSGLSTVLIAAVLWRRGGWRAAAPLAAGVVLALAPLSAFRAASSENPLPLQGNAGLNIYIGNGEGANGAPRVRPGYRWEKLVSWPELAGARGSVDSSAWFLRAAWDDARRDPGRQLGLFARKAVLFASDYPIDASQDVGRFERQSPLLRNALFNAAFLVPLAFGFLVAAAGRGAFRFCAAGFAGYWITVILTVFAVRYRAGGWPFIVLLAPGLFLGPPVVRPVRRAAGLSVAILLFIVTAIDPFGMKHYNPVRTEYNLGRIYYMEGNGPAAEKWFREAVRRENDDPDPWNAIGVLAAARGDTAAALAAYRRSLDLAGDYAAAHCNLALLLAGRSDLEGAKEHLQSAIRAVPSHAAAHYALGVLYEEEGRTESAESEYRIALKYDPTRDDAWAALGVLLAKENRRAEAERCLRKAVQLNPSSSASAANLEKLLSR